MTRLPSAASLGALCGAVVARWHDDEPPLEWEEAQACVRIARDGLEGDTARLCLVNCFQWHLEDECRASYDDLARLGALKRAIDESNARRVRCIDELDARIVRELAPADGAGAVALITPANVIDRISILELKRYHARGEKAAVVAEELADARNGLDVLLADLASGRQRVKLYGTTKIYGGASAPTGGVV